MRIVLLEQSADTSKFLLRYSFGCDDVDQGVVVFVDSGGQPFERLSKIGGCRKNITNMKTKQRPQRKPATKECHHCHQIVEENDKHDCWTTTERALTADLSEDLMDAWERLREAAVDFGEQRIYASHHCIMFSRSVCYFFVRPKKKVLEICFFLGRTIKSPMVRKTMPSSSCKIAHLVHITHRDEVEPPLTEWLKEAFDVSPALSATKRK